MRIATARLTAVTIAYKCLPEKIEPALVSLAADQRQPDLGQLRQDRSNEGP